MNRTTPIFVRYDNIFYHLSRFSNKIERLYLQQHLLTDDDGWVFKHEKNTSFWGYFSLSGDAYANGDGKDLMDEGSSSRLYSFNIYVYFDVIYYYRHYKKIFIIFSDGLPIINVIYSFFRMITKCLKISLGHKKLAEILFDNTIINKYKISESRINSLKFNQNKNLEDKKFDISKNPTSLKVNNYIDNFDQNNKDSKANDLSSVKMIYKNFSGENNILKKVSFQSEDNSLNVKNNLRNIQKYPELLDMPNNNNYSYGNIKSNNQNISLNNNNIGTDLKEFKMKTDEVNINNKSSFSYRSNYKKKELFPYKYFLCTIFIKDFNIYKQSRFVSYKFMLVYNFITQLLDISSYLVLQKESQIFKKILISKGYKEVLENIIKININDNTFDKEMADFLQFRKSSVLSRIKNK